MARGFIQLPPDSTGKQLDAYSYDVSGNTRYAQALCLAGTDGTPIPDPVALADGQANPTTTRLGAALQFYNGTTWDRARGDTTNGLDVDVTRVQGTVAVTQSGGWSVTADTELPAAAALADATANPTVPGVGSFLHFYNGTTWDRTRGTTANGLQVDVTRVQGTVAVTQSGSWSVTADTELPAAAALADGAANPTTPIIGAALQFYNGTTWDRARGDTTNGLDVDVTRVQGTVTVDSELPAAAALGDAMSNPTTPLIGSVNAFYNGSTHERARSLSSITSTSPATPTGYGVAAVALYNATTPTATPWAASSAVSDAAGGGNIGSAANWLYNGSNFDRIRSASSAHSTTGTGLLGAGLLIFDGTNFVRFVTASAVGDGAALGSSPTVANMLWNGSTYDRWKGDSNRGGRVHEHQPATSTVTRVTQASANTNTTLQASNSNRRTLKVYNEAGGIMYLKEGATASTTSYTAQIPQGDFYELQTPAYTGIVDCVWGSASGVALVTEQTN